MPKNSPSPLDGVLLFCRWRDESSLSRMTEDDKRTALVADISHHSGLPNMDGARLPLPSPTISPEAWERELGSYFDKDNLVQAFRYGWDLSLLPDPDPRDAPSNHPSAMDWASQVDPQIKVVEEVH